MATSGEEGTVLGKDGPACPVAAGLVPAPIAADAGMFAGSAAAACASAAVISSELNRTWAGASPGFLCCSNCSSLFSRDCAFAAAAAGDCTGATGCGFFNTRIMAIKDEASVAMLIIRSSFHFMQLSPHSQTLCYRRWTGGIT